MPIRSSDRLIRTRSAARLARALLAATIGASASFLGGCYSPGGSGYTNDVFTYTSTSWQPWTVSLIDTRTGESLWSVDVPVGKRLILSFRDGSGPNRYKPDMMRWGILEGNRSVGNFQSQLPVPPATARRLEPTLRAVPELPSSPMPGSPYEDVNWSLQKSGGVADGKADGMGAPKHVAPIRVPVEQPIPPKPAGSPDTPALQPETVKPSEAPPVEPAPQPAPEPAPAPPPAPAPSEATPKPAPAEQPKPEEPPVDLPGR